VLSAISERSQIVGPAFNAPNNSQHLFRGVRTFDTGPDRFDPQQDKKDAKKPGPSSYKPKILTSRKKVGYIKATASRFSEKEYLTEAPGPGSYRVQSEFGVYCVSSSLKEMPTDLFTKVASQKVFNRLTQKNPLM